ncbi:MAG: NAD(P)H-hydrate epimerase, partial [Bacteroidota bacterium]
MKIITPAQTRALDAHTITHEPIASLDLMERASLTFVHWFQEQFPDTDTPILIFCGIGNNGGDGLAVARLLSESHYAVQVFCCQISPNTS